MDHSKLKSLAFLSIARGSGFALLAIACVMAGAAFDVSVSLLTGGILSLITCLILCSKALFAMSVPYKRTEVWMMLDPEDRPSAYAAQKLIGSTLKVLYLKFARNFSLLAIALLAGALVCKA